MRYLVILNPVSGLFRSSQLRAWLSQYAQGGDISFTFRETSEDFSAGELVSDASNFDRVIACGGDGTVMQVAGGLVESGVPLCIVPSGTGNVIARKLNIAAMTWTACQDAVRPDGEMTELLIDLGCLNGKHYFGMRLSIGYEASVMVDSPRELKRKFGIGVYVLRAVQHALQITPVNYRISTDEDQINLSAENLWVANFGTLGFLGLDLDPNIKVTDGKLDLVSISIPDAPSAVRGVMSLVRGEQLPDEVVKRIPFEKEIFIESDSPQPVQIDGDFVGYTPCRIHIAPRSARILIPTRIAKTLSLGS